VNGAPHGFAAKLGVHNSRAVGSISEAAVAVCVGNLDPDGLVKGWSPTIGISSWTNAFIELVRYSDSAGEHDGGYDLGSIAANSGAAPRPPQEILPPRQNQMMDEIDVQTYLETRQSWPVSDSVRS